MKNYQKILIGIAFLVLGFIGYYYYQYKQKEAKCASDIYLGHNYFSGADVYYSYSEGQVNGRQFKTYEEGIFYCMKSNRKHF